MDRFDAAHAEAAALGWALAAYRFEKYKAPKRAARKLVERKQPETEAVDLTEAERNTTQRFQELVQHVEGAMAALLRDAQPPKPKKEKAKPPPKPAKKEKRDEAPTPDASAEATAETVEADDGSDDDAAAEDEDEEVIDLDAEL